MMINEEETRQWSLEGFPSAALVLTVMQIHKGTTSGG